MSFRLTSGSDGKGCETFASAKVQQKNEMCKYLGEKMPNDVDKVDEDPQKRAKKERSSAPNIQK